jgi:hypothetical protein
LPIFSIGFVQNQQVGPIFTLCLRSFFLVIFLQQQAPVFLCSFSQAVDVALVFHCLRSIIGSGLFSRFHFFGSRVKDAPGGFAASRVISFFPA